MFKALQAARGDSGGDASFEAGILPHTMALLCIKQFFFPLGVRGRDGREEGSLALLCGHISHTMFSSK